MTCKSPLQHIVSFLRSAHGSYSSKIFGELEICRHIAWITRVLEKLFRPLGWMEALSNYSHLSNNRPLANKRPLYYITLHSRFTT